MAGVGKRGSLPLHIGLAGALAMIKISEFIAYPW